MKEVLLPFVLLCVFFAAWGIYLFVTDTWEECLWWAYRFNREIYSEYTNYGKSIITTLLNPFLTYGTMCRDVIQNLTVNFYYNIRILCEVAINFIFVFYFGQKNIVEGVLLFCFCIWTNSRGFSANPSFHALPYWSVTAFMAAFLMLRICRKNQTRCAIVLLGAGIPITTSLYSVNGYKIMEQKQDISKDVRYYVDLLTEEQEPVYLVNLTGEYSYDDLKRRPAANLIYVHPWFMKVYEKQLVK